MDKLDELNKEWEDLIVGLHVTLSVRRRIATLHSEIVQEILKLINIGMKDLQQQMIKDIRGETNDNSTI